MESLLSLPDSLRTQIQEAASSALGTNPNGLVQSMDPLQRIVAEIARESPELLVALILANNSSFTGIETVETEERTEDRVVETCDGHYTYRLVKPMKTKRVVHREVRFLSERTRGLRERQ
jgi:hypothetical protein